jgi:hypothetical protein
MVCAPELGRYEDILPLDTGIKCLLQTLTNLVFVAIAVCAIDMRVSVLEGTGNGFLDLSRCRLPSSYQQSVFMKALEELAGSPRPRAGIEAPVFKGKRASETLIEPMIDCE